MAPTATQEISFSMVSPTTRRAFSTVSGDPKLPRDLPADMTYAGGQPTCQGPLQGSRGLQLHTILRWILPRAPAILQPFRARQIHTGFRQRKVNLRSPQDVWHVFILAWGDPHSHKPSRKSQLPYIVNAHKACKVLILSFSYITELSISLCKWSFYFLSLWMSLAILGTSYE